MNQTLSFVENQCVGAIKPLCAPTLLFHPQGLKPIFFWNVEARLKPVP